MISTQSFYNKIIKMTKKNPIFDLYDDDDEVAIIDVIIDMRNTLNKIAETNTLEYREKYSHMDNYAYSTYVARVKSAAWNELDDICECMNMNFQFSKISIEAGLHLLDAILKVIKPIYEELAETEMAMLDRMLGKTD